MGDKAGTPREPGEVQSVIKVLKILEALAENDKISLTDLSALVKSHKSTVYRFMCTLIDAGYARRDENDLYSSTLKLFQLGMSQGSSTSSVSFSCVITRTSCRLSKSAAGIRYPDCVR